MNAGFGGGPGGPGGPHHTNDLGGSSGGQSRHDSGQTGPGNGFGSHSGLLSNHHLHNGLVGPQNQQTGLGLGLKNENSSGPGGMAGQHNRPQPFLLEKQQQQQNLSKDWQDGLRALLPNVNVSFGALPHGPPHAQNGTASDHNPHSAAPQGQRMYSQQSMMNHEHHHSQHERQMQRHQHHQQQQQQQQQQHQHHQSRSGNQSTFWEEIMFFFNN